MPLPLCLLPQARDRRVLGLLECLRLAAPRAPAHQDPAISQRLWSIAKAYWLQAGAAATAAQQQLLAAARVAAANGQGSPDGSSSSSSAAALNGSAVPSLGPLLAGLQAAGLSLSREQLAAAQSLISARQEDALRQQAWVAALWGLAAIGGPLFFTAEVDALAQVGGRGGVWRDGGMRAVHVAAVHMGSCAYGHPQSYCYYCLQLILFCWSSTAATPAASARSAACAGCCAEPLAAEQL